MQVPVYKTQLKQESLFHICIIIYEQLILGADQTGNLCIPISNDLFADCWLAFILEGPVVLRLSPFSGLNLLLFNFSNFCHSFDNGKFLLNGIQ